MRRRRCSEVPKVYIGEADRSSLRLPPARRAPLEPRMGGDSPTFGNRARTNSSARERCSRSRADADLPIRWTTIATASPTSSAHVAASRAPWAMAHAAISTADSAWSRSADQAQRSRRAHAEPSSATASLARSTRSGSVSAAAMARASSPSQLPGDVRVASAELRAVVSKRLTLGIRPASAALGPRELPSHCEVANSRLAPALAASPSPTTHDESTCQNGSR